MVPGARAKRIAAELPESGARLTNEIPKVFGEGAGSAWSRLGLERGGHEQGQAGKHISQVHGVAVLFRTSSTPSFLPIDESQAGLAHVGNDTRVPFSVMVVPPHR
jgi:hypothetical protein